MKRCSSSWSRLAIVFSFILFSQTLLGEENWLAPLRREVGTLGKQKWRPLLRYALELHLRSTHRAVTPFEFDWQEIGPGYGYGPAFGHWDIVHEILDVLPSATTHAREQLLNDIQLQQSDGFLPGVVWMPGSPNATGNKATFNKDTQSHPPVWIVAADDYWAITSDKEFLVQCFKVAIRQIGWFEKHRRADPDGFFYNDILLRKWESGVDEGIRFDNGESGRLACIDATAHVYQLYDTVARWAKLTGENPAPWAVRATELREFIRNRLWNADDGFFYDIWSVGQSLYRPQAFEGIWPLVVGAATPEQANRVVDGWLLNPSRLFTKHPISTVGVRDPKFSRRMWRGPSWNSMTYWAARGCLRYGRHDAARRLLEAALDDTAHQFDRSGTIWEFYDPHGGRPEDLLRKPQTKRNRPWRDYLGHNPLFAMARMWQRICDAGSPL